MPNNGGRNIESVVVNKNSCLNTRNGRIRNSKARWKSLVKVQFCGHKVAACWKAPGRELAGIMDPWFPYPHSA